MSWIIESLLRSSVELKTKSDLDSDEYNDLMVVEKKIKDLHKDGIISEEEMALIHYIEDGKPMVNSRDEIGKNRISISKDFVTLCNKIAFFMGGEFTDDGYLDYMRAKYNLTDDQIIRMEKYMKSKYKNKLIRKQTKTNE